MFWYSDSRPVFKHIDISILLLLLYIIVVVIIIIIIIFDTVNIF